MTTPRTKRPPPQVRARHPLTTREEHEYLVAGSKLFNRRLFFETHEEWEEVWRRAVGSRRELLRGLIQVSVGYEHLKRGNHYGTRSLLRQGMRRLRPHVRRPGVRALVRRATDDVRRVEQDPSMTLRRLRPPKVMLHLRGFQAAAPSGAIEIEIPRASPRRAAAAR